MKIKKCECKKACGTLIDKKGVVCCIVPSKCKFLSSYMEALGSTQTVLANQNFVFDIDTTDSVGNNITLDSTGTTFTINEMGLYSIEWNMNLALGTTSALVGIIENGQGASGSSCNNYGSFASGTLIYVDSVPFTISLYNYNGDVSIENLPGWDGSALSIRIVRFADGPKT